MSVTLKRLADTVRNSVIMLFVLNLCVWHPIQLVYTDLTNIQIKLFYYVYIEISKQYYKTVQIKLVQN